MNTQPGFFVAIDGPSGIGKTTITSLLAHQLTTQGHHVLATKEPTATPLGSLARFGTDDYHGLTLACLVAADRYQHLEQQIRPALRSGQIVLCDRCLASSLVLQRLDGVLPEFVWKLHQHADQPNLCIILTGDPAQAHQRAEKRGLYSRFHRGGPQASMTEAALYPIAAADLTEHGFSVLTYNTNAQEPSQIAAALATTILAQQATQPGAS
jgi:dTMP kinase